MRLAEEIARLLIRGGSGEGRLQELWDYAACPAVATCDLLTAAVAASLAMTSPWYSIYSRDCWAVAAMPHARPRPEGIAACSLLLSDEGRLALALLPEELAQAAEEAAALYAFSALGFLEMRRTSV